MNTEFRGVRVAVRGFLAVVALWGMLTGAVPPIAQADAVDTPVAFSIPAGSLGAALNEVAIQANLQIFFEEASVQGLTAPELHATVPAQEALRTLLGNTRLEYVQNADNTILIRSQPRRVAQRSKPSHKAASAVAEGAAAPGPASVTVPATDGSWILRARGVYFDPRNDSNAIHLENPALDVPSGGVRTNERGYPELDVEHFWSRHWSTELAVTAPEYQDLEVVSAPSGARTRVGHFQQQVTDLTLKYTFLPDAGFRPYVGVGVDHASLSKSSGSPDRLSANTTGPAAQAGFDLKIGNAWFLNADVKWSRERPYLEVSGVRAGQLQVDPVRIGVGIGYRFGGTPAHTVPVAAVPVRDSDADGVPDDRDQCPNTPAGTKVDPKGCPLDTDGDGVPDTLDQCPTTPSGVKVGASGCPLDSDEDGVPDYLDRCPVTPKGLKVDANGCEIEELVLRGVTFETGSARLTPDSAATLDGVAAVLRQRPNAKVQVHGYTDSVGGEALNRRLSLRRAQAVVGYFEKAGISPDGMSAQGFGKADPVAGNDTAAGRAQNRRVTVRFMSPVVREGH